jgi:SEC-C motif domain protein
MRAEKKHRGPCLCGSLKSYETCCQRWHGGETPGDAEALMRSRYTAYVLKLEDYLLATWHPRTRPPSLLLAQSPRRWLGLKVLRHELLAADEALVEFVARYKASGRMHDMRETSRFVRENGRWLYVDGDIAEAKEGRALTN